MKANEEPTALSRPAEALLNLFAGLRGKGAEGNIDLQTAVMIPIVAAMLADGRVEPQELLQIKSVCEFSPIFERNSSTQNEFLIAYARQIIEDRGLEKACRMAGALLSPGLRETAFVHAIRVIFSDGYIGEIERQVIEQMANWMEIEGDRARIMIEVVSVMQHPETA